jgi:heat shock protein HtpX
MYKEIASNKRKSTFFIILFFALITLIGWWVSWYFEFGPGFIILAMIIAVAMSLFSYYQGDKVALSVSGAKAIKKSDNPYTYRLIENLCITAGLPLPKIYIINDPALNAFATGRDPEHASIALTTGLIQSLENEELEGVIAHELSHIKNYDIRLMMVVIICVGFIALIADFTLRSYLWGGMGRRGGNNKGNLGVILLVIGLIMAVLAPLASKLIQLAISRKREFLADASGALLTRYPEGLALALEKIQASTTRLKKANRATAHLYIANPFKRDTIKRTVSSLFATHPPIAIRIKKLRGFV